VDDRFVGRQGPYLGKLVEEVVEAGPGGNGGLYLAHGRKDTHKADEVLAEGRLSF
jgi:hypothetical protein